MVIESVAGIGAAFLPPPSFRDRHGWGACSLPLHPPGVPSMLGRDPSRLDGERGGGLEGDARGPLGRRQTPRASSLEGRQQSDSGHGSIGGIGAEMSLERGQRTPGGPKCWGWGSNSPKTLTNRNNWEKHFCPESLGSCGGHLLGSLFGLWIKKCRQKNLFCIAL